MRQSKGSAIFWVIRANLPTFIAGLLLIVVALQFIDRSKDPNLRKELREVKSELKAEKKRSARTFDSLASLSNKLSVELAQERKYVDSWREKYLEEYNGRRKDKASKNDKNITDIRDNDLGESLELLESNLNQK